jgi:hypothetical protein
MNRKEPGSLPTTKSARKRNKASEEQKHWTPVQPEQEERIARHTASPIESGTCCAPFCKVREREGDQETTCRVDFNADSLKVCVRPDSG